MKAIKTMLLVLLLVSTPICQNTTQKLYRRITVHWLANGGKIISIFTDWIILQIFSTATSTIKCPFQGWYNFKQGSVQRFNNLYFPAEDVITISLVQKGIFFDDGATITSSNLTRPGFYAAKIAIYDFRPQVTIFLEYLGVTLGVTISPSNVPADYYFLLQVEPFLINATDVGIPIQCSHGSVTNGTRANRTYLFILLIAALFILC